MFDYNRGYAEDLEASGVADIFRLPKFSYYFYQSQRDASERAGAMAFIASYWTEKSPLDVRVFSNGDEVELFLRARIVDENGTLVPDATPPVKFTVEGDASIIGENPVAAEAGIATVLLKTGVKGGAISLKATADMLKGEIVVDAE